MNASAGIHKKRLLHFLLIAIIAFGIYANSIPNNFAFDEPVLIINNQAVHGLSLKHMEAVFTSVPNGLEYLPIRDISYMLDYDLWGLAPFGYHLLNVIIYAASCLALYWALLLLFEALGTGQEGFLAFIAALLFAAHPAHVESVAGVAQRKDVLSGLFFFLGMGFYLKSGVKKSAVSYTLSLLFCVLALLSKTTAIVFPAAIAFIEFWKSGGGEKTPWRKATLRLLPFFIVTGGIAVLNFIVAARAGVVGAPASLSSKIPLSLAASVEYIKILIVPYPLTLWHDDMLKISPILSLSGALRLAFLLAILILVLIFRKRAPAPTFGGALMLVSLLPVIGLIRQPAAVAERYLFISSAGFCIAAAWALGNAARRKAGVLLLAAVLLAYSAITFERNFDWKTGSTLAEAGLRVNPRSARLNYFLGNIEFQNGRYADAMDRFNTAGRLDPHYGFAAPFFKSLYLYNRGMCRDALQPLTGLDQLGFSDVYCLRGKIYACLGENVQARAEAQKALDARRTIGYFFRPDALALLGSTH